MHSAEARYLGAQDRGELSDVIVVKAAGRHLHGGERWEVEALEEIRALACPCIETKCTKLGERDASHVLGVFFIGKTEWFVASLFDVQSLQGGKHATNDHEVYDAWRWREF